MFICEWFLSLNIIAEGFSPKLMHELSCVRFCIYSTVYAFIFSWVDIDVVSSFSFVFSNSSATKILVLLS